MYMSVKTFEKNSVHNFVRPRWVELYWTPGNWSVLFRTGVFHGGSTVWLLDFVLSPGSWQFLNVSLLPPESYHFYAALGLYFVTIFYSTSDFLLVVISPCLEMMSVYLWSTVKLVIWATQHACGLEKERVRPLFRHLMKPVISGSSPSSENSDVICICCQNCSFMILDV